METILKIKETQFGISERYPNDFDGFVIKTNKQIIKLGIENGQSCCEYWGYFMTEDNFKEFEGSKLIDITLTDTSLKTKKLYEECIETEECMFVNLNTDKGLLQFVAYNSHNGYYGHEAVIISETLNHSEML